MYQALYRKWRPQVFDDVIGQQHITDSLKNQVQGGHLSHAYIFIGTRGTGKTTCARILARAVNCEHPVNGNPCCKCASCVSIGDGTAMDIVELDAASNNGVDNVRALREEAVFSPSVLKKRVYIIDEVHMLSTAAFNALLKILEEPPEHLMFILATTELQKVPATILSRCQRHSFRRIERTVLASHLQNIAGRENISLTPDAAELLAGLAEGGVRDALSMLDQCSVYGTIGRDEVYATVGLAGSERMTELFVAMIEKDTSNALELFNNLWVEGKDPASLFRELSSLVRDVLLMKVAPKNAAELVYGGYNRATLKEFAYKCTAEELSGMLDALQSALGNMKDRLNPRMAAELCIVSLCTNIAGDTVAGLRARVAALERMIRSGSFHRENVNSSASEPDESAYPDETEAAEPQQVQYSAPHVFEKPADSESRHIQKKETFLRLAETDTNELPFTAALPTEEKIPAELPAARAECTAEDFRSATVAVVSEDTALDTEYNSVNIWQDVYSMVKDRLPKDIAYSMDVSTVGYLEGNTLIIEVTPGFYYLRLNNPDLLEMFASAAGKLTGKSVTARLKERVNRMTPEEGRKALEELRKFDIVKFV